MELFTDKAVSIDTGPRPYLYGLVLDERGAPVGTRSQAKAFAKYLCTKKLQTRTIMGDQRTRTSRGVTLAMVKQYETKAAMRYQAGILPSSARWNISATLVLANMRTESRFNPSAVSAAPAYGLMQLVPSSGMRDVFKSVSGINEIPTAASLSDPAHSIELGAAYLSKLSSGYFSAIRDQDSRDLCYRDSG